jgi:hypothetical protein
MKGLGTGLISEFRVEIAFSGETTEACVTFLT